MQATIRQTTQNALIKPLLIGDKKFPVNLIQGPLAGVSCAPFRRLTWQYGQPAFSCSEMISCKTILHQPKLSLRRFVYKDPHEGPVCIQLSASNANELAEATKKVTDYGADLIDLNCGCPVRKIRSRGAGSSLLSNLALLDQLIQAMRKNTHLPISIKIRIEGQSDDRFNKDIVSLVNDSGIDFLIVHGRHWTESYDTPCDLQQIGFFVAESKIPVIGNGDISNSESLMKMFATGCAGAMISRAGVGQPWLIQKLIAELNQEHFTIPSLEEIGMIFMEHVYQLTDLLGNEKFSILQVRKFAKYYARNMPHKTLFCDAVNTCETLIDLKNICAEYFK